MVLNVLLKVFECPTESLLNENKIIELILSLFFCIVNFHLVFFVDSQQIDFPAKFVLVIFPWEKNSSSEHSLVSLDR